ncbi:hypothetical protein ACFBZI_03630 [Moraxella sp. ZJ142]
MPNPPPSLPQPALERMDVGSFAELVGEMIGFLGDNHDTAAPDELKK